jgi:hypothetical protein
MDKDREIFLQKLNKLIIDSKNIDKKRIKQKYLELVFSPIQTTTNKYDILGV